MSDFERRHLASDPKTGTAIAGASPEKLVTLEELYEAQQRIRPTCLRTPLLPVPHPSADGLLWVKAESLQRTGSFKLRGVANAIAALDPNESRAGVVTYSAGNHGRALAFAARKAGIPATVIMPETASTQKVFQTRSEGATVLLLPPDEIVTHTQRLSAQQGLIIVPPFDDRRVIAGQGTVGLELLEQLDSVDVVLVPVGGGGLVAGVATAIKNLRPSAQVIAVEPELAGDLAEGFAMGERATWSRKQTRRTIADGLRSPTVGALPWEHVRSLVDDVVTVSEESIVSAMRWLAEHAKLIVEPSGAVATAAVLEHSQSLPAGTTVTVATGGNIDLQTFVSQVGN
jgi:threonine dehydratase